RGIWVLQETFDESLPFIRRGLIQEVAHFDGPWYPACQVKVNAAKEFRIVCKRCRLDTVGGPAFGDELIDPRRELVHVEHGVGRRRGWLSLCRDRRVRLDIGRHPDKADTHADDEPQPMVFHGRSLLSTVRGTHSLF